MNLFARRRLRATHAGALTGAKVFRREALGFRLRCTPSPATALDAFTRRALALRRPEGPQA